MDLSLIVDVVIVLVIVAVTFSIARAWRTRPARAHLTALDPEARDRYLAAWDRIEKRFMDAPEEAAQEADAVLTALLGERGHPLGADRIPYQLRKARRNLADGRRRHRTEDLRRALLNYRAVFGRMIGPDMREQAGEGRRETA
jgi:hypothetical protein